MSPIADLVVNQVAAYGILPVIFVGSGLILTAWTGLGALLDWAEQRHIRRAEAAQRQADLDICNAILTATIRSPREEKP